MYKMYSYILIAITINLTIRRKYFLYYISAVGKSINMIDTMIFVFAYSSVVCASRKEVCVVRTIHEHFHSKPNSKIREIS